MKKAAEQFILHLKHYNLRWPNGMEIDTRQALMAFLLTMTHIVTRKLQLHLLTHTQPAALCDTRHSTLVSGAV